MTPHFNFAQKIEPLIFDDVRMNIFAIFFYLLFLGRRDKFRAPFYCLKPNNWFDWAQILPLFHHVVSYNFKVQNNSSFGKGIAGLTELATAFHCLKRNTTKWILLKVYLELKLYLAKEVFFFRLKNLNQGCVKNSTGPWKRWIG